MKKYFAFLFLFMLTLSHTALRGQRLRVSENQRFLVTEDGKPFFWLADTAWELLHRCDKAQIKQYLQHRKKQGFNVIQTVALAELDGLRIPNKAGALPLSNMDPATPNPDYFELVDYTIDLAASLDMYIALLPTWGDKLFTNSWGIGPEVLNEKNAYTFGKWLGERYEEKEHLIWVIGGDRNPRENSNDVAVWNALASGVLAGYEQPDNALMTYHPQPKKGGGSSTWFHGQSWLDFNMHQTGHCANQGTYKQIQHDYKLRPTKPVLDGEPLYEDHPNCFNAQELGYSLPRDIRRIMYWNVFAGAFGQTYGCHAVWQMHTTDQEGVNGPLRPWQEALDMPMANQMKHLKNLMESRPMLTRIPDQSMILDEQAETNGYTAATRDTAGTYAFIYFPEGSSRRLSLAKMQGKTFSTIWYDPRTGNQQKGGTILKKEIEVKPPTHGLGNDWVLIIDAEAIGQ